jgi:hypothetical protein
MLSPKREKIFKKSMGSIKALFLVLTHNDKITSDMEAFAGARLSL